MKCGIAIRPIAIPHLNYGTATVESSRLTICGLNYLPIDAHTHTSGHTVAIQAERTRAFTRGAGAHLPASRTPVAESSTPPSRGIPEAGSRDYARDDELGTRGMTKDGRCGMARYRTAPPFVMLREAKRSRSTQTQRLSENREPRSRDFARDDESLAARDDER